MARHRVSKSLGEMVSPHSPFIANGLAVPQSGGTLATGSRLATRKGIRMPRYYFNVVAPGRTITDPNGRELAGLEAAHWHAVGLAYQIRFHLPYDDGAWSIQITDEERRTREVFVPFFSKAALAKKKIRISKSLTAIGSLSP